MTNTVEWLVELSVAEDQTDAAAALLDEMAETIKANEPGTETWAWYRAEDGGTVSILERYRDEAIVTAHLTNFGDFADRFLAILTPVRFTVLADPSPDLREVIAGFGPIYRAPGGGFRR